MGSPRNRRRRGKGAELAAAVAALVVGSGGVCRAGASAYSSRGGVVTVAKIGEMKWRKTQGRFLGPESLVMIL